LPQRFALSVQIAHQRDDFRHLLSVCEAPTTAATCRRLWGQEKTDNWSGVSIKHPDWTMVGTIRTDKGGQWVEYIEKLQATTVSDGNRDI
jgi:hypothetical protein